MKKNRRNSVLFVVLIAVTIFLFVANIAYGSVAIPVKEVIGSLFGSSPSKETWEYIIINYRLPKAITAVLAGIGLSVSGLLMQTLFRNPLAGPYVLGLSSGSSLGVAIVLLAASSIPGVLSVFLLSSYGIIFASFLGSFVVMLSVLAISKKLRDTMSILIVGLMFASFTAAVVGVLTYFSTADQLQKFTFWSLGNLGNLSWTSILILVASVLSGIVLSYSQVKSLDAFLLGDNYARSLGVNIKKSRTIIILATSILAGSITAFAGPIAFIGLAVPHIAKLVFQTSGHVVLFWATVLLGAMILLLCDMISQFPGSNLTLPINAVTSIVGAPVVIWLLLRKRTLNY